MGEPWLALAIVVPTGGVAILAYLVVGLVIGVESMGVPLPGETTLIAAALLASQGHLHIEFVIAGGKEGSQRVGIMGTCRSQPHRDLEPSRPRLAPRAGNR